MNEFKRFLEYCAGTGVIISLAYSGGSRPGAARNITPLAVSNDILEAIDTSSNQIKQYKINKIKWISPLNGEEIPNPDFSNSSIPNLPVLHDIPDYLSLIQRVIENKGWFIRHDAHSISLSSFLKNGNPRKTPSISISFQDRQSELVWDLATNDFIEISKTMNGRERPWRVDSWRFQEGKTYKNLHHAMTVFFEEATTSIPSDAKKK